MLSDKFWLCEICYFARRSLSQKFAKWKIKSHGIDCQYIQLAWNIIVDKHRRRKASARFSVAERLNRWHNKLSLIQSLSTLFMRARANESGSRKRYAPGIGQRRRRATRVVARLRRHVVGSNKTLITARRRWANGCPDASRPMRASLYTLCPLRC